MKKYKVIYIDLDGTLIDTLTGNEFPVNVWDMKLKLDVFDAIKNLSPQYIFIVTNQGGIGKFVDELDFERKLDYVASCVYTYCKTPENDIEVNSMYCASTDKTNNFRKPNIGMFEYFNEYYNFENIGIRKNNMLMIGDASGLPGNFSDSDKLASQNFGIDYMDVNEFIDNYGKRTETTE